MRNYVFRYRNSLPKSVLQKGSSVNFLQISQDNTYRLAQRWYYFSTKKLWHKNFLGILQIFLEKFFYELQVTSSNLPVTRQKSWVVNDRSKVTSLNPRVRCSSHKLENESTGWWRFDVQVQILKHKLKIKNLSWNWKSQAI